jgi:hypothetical protein
MANYLCSCRSTYFKVKDDAKFIAWASGISEITARIEADGDHKGFAVILGNDPDGGGWPGQWFNDKKDELEEFDFFNELSQHLAKDWSVILMEAGAEKLRYIIAQAVLVDWRGRVKVIDAEDEALKVARRWKVRTNATEC